MSEEEWQKRNRQSFVFCMFIMLTCLGLVGAMLSVM